MYQAFYDTKFYRSAALCAVISLLLLIAGCNSDRNAESVGVESAYFRKLENAKSNLANKADTLLIEHMRDSAATMRYLYPDAALQLIDSALEKCKREKYYKGIGDALIVKALILVEQEKYDEAIASMNDAKRYIGQGKRKIMWHLNLAVVYSHTDDFSQQLENYMAAIKLLDSIGNSKDKMYAPVYLNISNVWSTIGDQEKRDFYLKKAIEVASQNYGSKDNDFSGKDVLSGLYNTEGGNFIDKGQYNSAISTLQKSVSICDALPLLVKRKKNAFILLSLAHLYNNDYRQAEHYISLYKSIDNNSDKQLSKAEPNTILAEIYFRKGDFNRALRYADDALEGISVPGKYDKAKLLRVRRVKAEALGRSGRNDSAVAEYQTLLRLKDDILNEEKIKTNRRLDFIYQTEAKDRSLAEKELLLLQNTTQLRNQRIVTGMVAAGLIISLLLLYIFRNRQQLQKKAFLLQSRENELKYLKEITFIEEQQRRRIGAELHDGISGSIAAIKMNMSAVKKHHPTLNDSEIYLETQEMLKETADEIRRTAHNLIPEILLQNGLNEAIITHINRIRNNHPFELEYNYIIEEPQLSEDASLTLFRIIQELVQNIVKHSKAKKASIQLLENKGKVTLIVEDNGVGFNMNVSFNGIGLYNIRMRVMSLEGDIDIQSVLGKHTIITMTFDKNKLTSTNIKATA